MIHVTSAGLAVEILESGSISRSLCSVFARPLAYFFLARPAYKSKNHKIKSDQVSRFPVVFVLKPEKLGTPHHIYPFDTGAASAGIFGDDPDPSVYLEDYELDPDLNSAARHIEWAFGDLSAYFRGDLKLDLYDQTSAFELEVKSFLKIARLALRSQNDPEKSDIRASTVEVAYNLNIPLKGSLDFVIFPDKMIEDQGKTNSRLVDLLRDAGISRPETYGWSPSSMPEDYDDIVSGIVARRLGI